jgi:hypothetical protein
MVRSDAIDYDKLPAPVQGHGLLDSTLERKPPVCANHLDAMQSKKSL